LNGNQNPEGVEQEDREKDQVMYHCRTIDESQRDSSLIATGETGGLLHHHSRNPEGVEQDAGTTHRSKAQLNTLKNSDVM